MSKAGGVLQSLTRALQSVGIKAPWRWTGPLSSPEYQSHLPAATEYRRHAPASPPVRPSVPAALPERVYDIKYYTRDTRRAGVGPGARLRMAASEVDPREGGAVEPATPGAPYRFKGKLRPITDNENGGYTA